MTDNISFTQLKYADILGKPLTKSLYRQLPVITDSLLDIDDDKYVWRFTMYGRINWCPSSCDAETNCRCDGECRRLSACKYKRTHQHLLIGANGSLSQGLVYLRLLEYEEWPLRDQFYNRYNPLMEEQHRLIEEQRNAKKIGWVEMTEISHEQLKEMTQRRDNIQMRVAQIEKELRAIDSRARHEINEWINAAIMTMPVILLRG